MDNTPNINFWVKEKISMNRRTFIKYTGKIAKFVIKMLAYALIFGIIVAVKIGSAILIPKMLM